MVSTNVVLKKILEYNKAWRISVSPAFEKWRQEDQDQPELHSVTLLQKILSKWLINVIHIATYM